MVSLQTAVSQKARTAGSSRELFSAPQSAAMFPTVPTDSSRKRKRDAKARCGGEGAGEFFIASASSINGSVKEGTGRGSFLELLMSANTSRSPATAEEGKGDEEDTSRAPQQMLDVELHLGDRPMPHEWQRCLDIQSGQVHIHNSRTHAPPSKNQRRSPPSPPISIGLDAPAPVGIDLELNLSCDSSSSVSSQWGSDINADQHKAKIKNKSSTAAAATTKAASAEAGAVAEATAESSHDEMVAAVCARCHMLIMMRRTSPSCPNCKFMHPPPPEQQQHGFGGRSLVRPAAGFNQLLCCRE